MPDSREHVREEYAEMAALMGQRGGSNCILVADTANHRREYVALACGQKPTVRGLDPGKDYSGLCPCDHVRCANSCGSRA